MQNNLKLTLYKYFLENHFPDYLIRELRECDEDFILNMLSNLLKNNELSPTSASFALFMDY